MPRNSFDAVQVESTQSTQRYEPDGLHSMTHSALRKEGQQATPDSSRNEPLARVASDFLERIAQGIRSPVNIMLGYNELLADRFEQLGDHSQSAYLDGIRRSGAQIVAAVNCLLDYSKIADGSLELKPQPIELAPLLEKVVERSRVLASSRNLQVTCAITESNAAVRCDLHCLNAALANLLDNAIRYSDRGGLVVRLHRDDDGALSIEIGESGAGFDSSAIARMLNGNAKSADLPEKQAAHEMARIGLVLAGAYLELIGARLFATGAGQNRSLFTIKLSPWLEDLRPARSALSGSDHLARPSPVMDGSELRSTGNPGVILIMEAQVDQAHYLRALLRGRYDSVVAKNAVEANARLEELGPRLRLILLDLALDSDEGGLGFAQRLRASERWRGLPIVITTACAFAEDRERALAAGATAYLSKPIGRADLLATIESLLA
jgi:CheY-like chemotaxis protein